jgi:hypothetical protein
VSGLVQRSLEESVRRRCLSGVVIRPRNFTVRRHRAHVPLSSRWLATSGRLPAAGAVIFSQLPECYLLGNDHLHISVAGDLRVQSMGWRIEGWLHLGG